MIWDEMQRAKINGTELAVWERGSGEPVVFVHGGMGDECAAVIQEPALTERFRVIHYHRRGWGRSAPLDAPISIAQQAQDCKAVMEHFGVRRAHMAGLSYGGIILLQMALEFPDAVHSLALLEPGLPQQLAESPEYAAAAGRAAASYAAGDRAGTIESFFGEICGNDFRAVFDRTMPPGWFERLVSELDTVFQMDVPAMESWSFTGEDAARITQPVLNMAGGDSPSYFQHVYRTLQNWFPHAENAVLPDAAHAMLQMNPKGSAERLAEFFARHPIAK
jgi:pimeloyl-ACP methyl ester carboxylesterase